MTAVNGKTRTKPYSPKNEEIIPAKRVKKVTTPGFNLRSGVNIALNKPLALPIDTAINEIIRRTNGSKVLKVSTGDEKMYFNPSSEKILLTVTIDVSRELLFILVISP